METSMRGSDFIFKVELPESPLKITKKSFYFILKALLVLKVVKRFPWLFGHVGKTAWLEA